MGIRVVFNLKTTRTRLAAMSCFRRRHVYFTGRHTNVCLTGLRAIPHSNSSNSPWRRQRPRCRTVAVTYRPVTSARLLFVRRHRRPGRPCPIRVIRLPPPTRSTCFRTNKTTRTNGTIVSTCLLAWHRFGVRSNYCGPRRNRKQKRSFI